jgi:fructose-1,6-bisphosphatase
MLTPMMLGGHGCMGRITCVLFDSCGKFEEFCVRDERCVERRFRAGVEQFDELVRKAWEEKWEVEILVEVIGENDDEHDNEIQVVKGIVLRG